MLSSSTLKYKITVNNSIYAAILVFALYSSLIVLLLLIFNISWLTFAFFVLLLLVAIYGAGQAYRQRYSLQLSDSGLVKIVSSANEELRSGRVAASSFYNGFFVSLHLKDNPSDLLNLSRNKKFSVVIYRDAVSESEYRLLARLINFGRDKGD